MSSSTFSTSFLNNKKKINCNICKGSGLISCSYEICNICHGKKCIQCKETGYKKFPFEECEYCYGSGYCSSYL